MAREASDKAQLRKRMRRTVDSLTPAQKEQGSTSIVEQLTHLLPANATCAAFCATQREPDLSALFETRRDLSIAYPRIVAPGKMVFYHTTCVSSLKPGAFGILEPDPCFPLIPPEELDFIFCPGLAFTHQGHRLGQGGGFYDRYLVRAPHTLSIGIAFSNQLLKELPVEDHDFIMGDIITSRE